MHLGDGAITAECVVLTAGAAGAGLAVAGMALRQRPVLRQDFRLAAGLAALVFAAQAINVPVWPGVSGHLVGGVLLAWAVGPALGAVAMSLIVVLQALLLGDGGLAALSANVLNMALLPAGLVAVVRQFAGSKTSAGLAALLSVPLAAGLIVVQTSLFRPLEEMAGWSSFAALMLGTHLWIGVLEAGLTVAALTAVDWLSHRGSRPAVARPALVCLAAGVVLAALVVPFSSVLPDGYEAAAQRTGRTDLLAEEHAALAQAGPLNAAAAGIQQSFVAGSQRVLGSQEGCLFAAILLVATLLAGSGAMMVRGHRSSAAG